MPGPIGPQGDPGKIGETGIQGKKFCHPFFSKVTWGISALETVDSALVIAIPGPYLRI